jgi:hypothetical protein
MTIKPELDLSLEALEQVAREISPELPEGLIKRCYEIQKKHQFSDERTQPFAAMERLVEDALEGLANGEAGVDE